MARNAEKAMTTLARWRASQVDEQVTTKRRRPYLASECIDAKDAQRWRLEIIREISRKVTQIQNAGLGEHRIRDLNDQINKLLREKKHWEIRIKELGGVEIKSTPRFDTSAREAPGNRGYKYFGAAKDLPGVRNLFDQEPPILPKKTRAELMKNVDADYYGYRDEDDGVILAEEARVQREELLKIAKNEIKTNDQDFIENRINEILKSDPHKDDACLDFVGPKNFISHIPLIPSQEEINDELIRRKKFELLKQYVSDHSMETESEQPTIESPNEQEQQNTEIESLNEQEQENTEIESPNEQQENTEIESLNEQEQENTEIESPNEQENTEIE